MGRLHVPRMQDLPFHPWYRAQPWTGCLRALVQHQQRTVDTAFLHGCLRDHLGLRTTLSG
ncbi:putative DNA polymerase [Pseudomonas phage PIP]|nr:putative DNA polymerase [Pseudomonas phage PIP]